MSAFIVSEKTMSDIIYNLYWSHKFKDRYYILNDNDIQTEADFDKLAIQLFKMNQDAIRQRYNEPENSDYSAIPEYVDWNTGTINKYQCLKSMQCLRYQCPEGDVPKTKLFKFLEDLISAWMDYIISGLPEYDNASWG